MLPTFLAQIGTTEIVLGVIVIVLLFGAAKIPQLARSLGRAKSEYAKASRDAEREMDDPDDDATLRAARELGIPTEGRPIAEIKADVRRKLGA